MKLPFLVSIALITAAYSKLFRTPSGKSIPLAAIHQYIPSAPEHVIPHILFEYNRKDASICNQFVSINITLLTDTFERIPNGQRKTIVHSGHGYTFAFDIHTADLIATWGPSFRLHPLNSAQYPNIFLNSATYNDPTISVSNGSTVDRVAHEHANARLSKTLSHMASRAQPCPITKEIALKSFLEPSFINMFDSNESRASDVVNVLYHRTSKLFMSVACVRIYISPMTSRYSATKEIVPKNTYKIPNYDNVEACVRNQSCDLASFLLHSFQIEAENTFNMWAFFTGYNFPQSTVVGAAFRGQLCAPGRTKVWIEGHDDAVLAHEIGHLLGASHDSQGFLMHKELNLSEPLRFSDRSKAEIQRFVNRDKRAWCLRFHNRDTLPALFGYFYDLRHSLSIVPGGGILTMLSTRPRKYRTYSYVRLEACGKYQKTYAIDKNGSVSIHEDLHSLPITGIEDSSEVSIAFGSSKNSETLLMFALTRNRNRLNRLQYRVGFGFNKYSGKPPTLWGPEMNLELTHYERSNLSLRQSQNFQSLSTFAIATGDVRQTGSHDLIVVYELYEFISNQWRAATYYNIGYNIGPKGEVRSGWTDPIEIPNLFSFDDDYYNGVMVLASNLQVSVVDLDGNGRPDLVVYYYLRHRRDWSYHQFIRVGFNLDSNGYASGGWSDLQPISKFKSLVIIQLPGCPKATVVGSYTSGGENDGQLHIETSANSITQNLLATVRSHAPFEDVSQGCGECFVGWGLQQCQKKLHLCASKIDEVHYSRTYQPSTMRSTVMNRQLDANDSLLSGKSVHPSKSNGTQSLFCLGFHYMILDSSFSCDIVDRERVISKGIEIAFLKDLRKSGVISGRDIDIQTLFADPKGGNGHYLGSVAAQAHLINKEEWQREAFRKSYKLIRRRKEFTGSGKDRLKSKTFKKRGNPLVQFYITDSHRHEAP